MLFNPTNYYHYFMFVISCKLPISYFRNYIFAYTYRISRHNLRNVKSDTILLGIRSCLRFHLF
ncbi:hypothetical protein GIB67_037960 [Kingdonia uniflora]|uniref:Uncharacterized protein n=1 Tax=Kingdonia uniflora TaxID=39325 RepID=A0A7J7LHD3_9MAGN|nr:hypothetical protein GIB67_037960 [Kingdonia uniflora]